MTALTDKLAMKAGSYSGTSEVTDVYFKTSPWVKSPSTT